MLKTIYEVFNSDELFNQPPYELTKHLTDTSEQYTGKSKDDYVHIRLALIELFTSEDYEDFKTKYFLLRTFAIRNITVYLDIIAQFKVCLYNWPGDLHLSHLCIYILLAAALVEKGRVKIGNSIIYSRSIDAYQEMNDEKSVHDCISKFGLGPIKGYIYGDSETVDSMIADSLDFYCIINSMSHYAQLLLEGYITDSPVSNEDYIDMITKLNQESSAICFKHFKSYYLREHSRSLKKDTTVDEFLDKILTNNEIVEYMPTVVQFNLPRNEVLFLTDSDFDFMYRMYEPEDAEVLQGCLEEDRKYIYSIQPLLNKDNNYESLAYTIALPGVAIYFIEDIVNNIIQIRLFFFKSNIKNYINSKITHNTLLDFANLTRSIVLVHVDNKLK